MDLKKILAEAGVEGRHVVLYLEDHHFVTEGILQAVNSLLSSGEVSGLYVLLDGC